jgi:NAD+--dinitrogen-reductase ADP-D-ribosyltransferase
MGTTPPPERSQPAAAISLARGTYLPINRANLPASILGGLTFQKHPCDLELDGVYQFHREFFETHLSASDSWVKRAENFMDYVDVAFRLFRLEDIGWQEDGPKKRTKATYLQVIRGWSVDSNGIEGAVLKGWVESRFGLLARYHAGSLRDPLGEPHAAYMQARSRGIFGTNALEAQLDLLYTFCQHELRREERIGEPSRLRPRGQALSGEHLRLYRGIDKITDYEIIEKLDRRRYILLLNNLNSFTSERERAEEFGSQILEVEVPRSKVFFHNRLIPKMLTGEDELMVIGGLYEVCVSLF